jgi:hypothetical protein
MMLSAAEIHHQYLIAASSMIGLKSRRMFTVGQTR